MAATASGLGSSGPSARLGGRSASQNENSRRDSSAPALEASDLSKRYGRRVWALKGITLEIRAGGITALVGPNAAGKSTLMKTWVGFERPTHGTVRVAGVDPARHREEALANVGYLPQVPALYRDLTVDDHLALAAHYRPAFDMVAARNWLDRLAISRRVRPRELSGGQAAQVGLAIALGTHVPILLMDEPLASLDPLARHEFLEVLREAVAKDGSTALLSSHIVGDITQACDWIILLGAGMKSLDSSIDEALARHRVVAQREWTSHGAAMVAPLPDGSLAVVESAPGAVFGRAPSLEEVVLAHLTKGRLAPAVEPAGTR